MPTVYALIAPKQQWEDANGNPLSGYKLFVYTAGTTTKETTYQDAAGTTPNSNPIVLNSLGQCTAGLYTTTGLKKLVMAPPTDTDPPSSPLWTFDNIRAPNDISTTIDQWVLGTTPTYINSTQFSVVGDQRTTYQVGRRIQAAVTAVTVYGRISASAFASVTTVTVVLDSGALDSGLSAVSYGLLSADNNSVPLLTDVYPLRSGSADKTKRWRAEVDSITAGAERISTIPDYDHRLGNIPAGVVMDYAGPSVPTGWLECDGAAVSRATYAALFTAISTTWGAGDGSTTFNLPNFRGRARIGRGTGTATAAGSNADVDTTNDTLTVASNTDKWITGMPVVFTLTSGTVTGLTSGVTYYIVRNNTTTVKLASSLANAQNGTVIDMTAKSSPVWTITHTLTARTLADQGGEQSHAMSSTELLSHVHAMNISNVGQDDLQSLGANAWFTSNTNTSATGGNAAMNIMQPYATVMTIISY